MIALEILPHRYPQSLEKRIYAAPGPSEKGQHLCRRIFSNSYSRQITNGPRYFTTTVVFLAELSKLAVSLIMLLYSCEWHMWKLKILLETEMVQKPMEFVKLVIPAGLYALQNNLVYIALSNLDPATYQVTSNLKLVTTVIFMRVILHRQFKYFQWTAVLMLFVGIVLVQIHAEMFSVSNSGHYLWGLISTLVIAVCAGFAGVYFEKLLKHSSVPFWVRNLEMYLWGLLSSGIGIVSYDLGSIKQHGFFHGYTSTVWFIVGMSGAGGLYASLVMKYLDNILKNFSSCTAIILTAIGSNIIFNTDTGVFFVFGSFLVCFSVFLYSIRNST
ncbi:CMP-sialic acid transporter-like isoform X3 [Tachypleus tridentatus]|uniref:CMP-sialic acid transporter-like isoform X3 n=1 Tax=Tachypleus tridentatus TaxID=6853 RepID=UPI003FD0C450